MKLMIPIKTNYKLKLIPNLPYLYGNILSYSLNGYLIYSSCKYRYNSPFKFINKKAVRLYHTFHDKQNKKFNINWYNLDKKGIITLNNHPFLCTTSNNTEIKAGVYIYQLVFDKSIFYIGSTYNIPKRLRQHRNNANKKNKTCPKFYNSVTKYGWENFKLGILEYIDIYKINSSYKSNIRKIILEREQFYLDEMSPTLNINKVASSMLGFKHSQVVRVKMGIQHRGIPIIRSKENLPYIATKKTRDILSVRARHGVVVRVFDFNNNIINTFPTIASAAKHYNIDHNTMSNYIKSDYQINNHRFEFKVKDVRVWIYDKQDNLVDVFPTANKAAQFCGIYHIILARHVKSGKLWNNKYYFKTHSTIL